jgi:hypothetical protein
MTFRLVLQQECESSMTSSALRVILCMYECILLLTLRLLLQLLFCYTTICAFLHAVLSIENSPGISEEFQRNFRGISEEFQRNFRGISEEFQRNFTRIM